MHRYIIYILLICLSCTGGIGFARSKPLLGIEYIEIADNPPEREQGLMGRDWLDGELMIFVYDRPEIMTYWMKNTPTSLDIVFLNERGQVIALYEHTIPLNDQILYSSHRPAQYVLELRAGSVGRSSIRVGDHIANLSSLLQKGQAYMYW